MPHARSLLPFALASIVAVAVAGCSSTPDSKRESDSPPIEVRGPETYAEHVDRMRFADLEVGRMAYVDEGSGPAVVVLVHGIPTSSWMYREVIARLADDGYRVIAPDLIGMGASERPDDDDALLVPAQAAALLELLSDELALDGWTHVVHDFGGPITWEMMEDPRFKARELVILDTFAFDEGWSPGLGFFSKLMTEAGSTALFDEAYYRSAITGMVHDGDILTDRVMKGYCKPLLDGAGHTYKCLYYSANDLREELPRYQATLAAWRGAEPRIVWGRHDPFLSADEQVDRFRRLLEVDATRVRILEGTGHLVAEESPDEVVRMIKGDASPRTAAATLAPSKTNP